MDTFKVFFKNVLGTETESFLTMHDTYDPEYKSFEKQKFGLSKLCCLFQ